jgi:hypothetical protein
MVGHFREVLSMSVSDELQKLAELYRTGTISGEEFELAKRRLLTDESATADSNQAKGRLKRRELAQIDQRWQSLRESHGVFDRHGHWSPLGKFNTFVEGAMLAVFGLLVMVPSVIATAADGRFSLIAVFGTAVMVYGIVIWINAYIKIRHYKSDQRLFRRRRRQIEDQYPDSRPR